MQHKETRSGVTTTGCAGLLHRVFAKLRNPDAVFEWLKHGASNDQLRSIAAALAPEKHPFHRRLFGQSFPSTETELWRGPLYSPLDGGFPGASSMNTQRTTKDAATRFGIYHRLATAPGTSRLGSWGSAIGEKAALLEPSGFCRKVVDVFGPAFALPKFLKPSVSCES